MIASILFMYGTTKIAMLHTFNNTAQSVMKQLLSIILLL